jgi:hypothetical protein
VDTLNILILFVIAIWFAIGLVVGYFLGYNDGKKMPDIKDA